MIVHLLAVAIIKVRSRFIPSFLPEHQSGSKTGPGMWPSLHEGLAWGCPPPICRCHHRNAAGGQNILGPEVLRMLQPALGAPENDKVFDKVKLK